MDYVISIIVSALLFAISFMVPQFWWCILLFTLPLYGISKTFCGGFVWGLIAFGLHSSGVLWSVMSMQEGSWALRLIPSLLIISFMAIHGAVWFAVQGVVERRCRWNIQLVLMPFIQTCFFWYIAYALLLPLGLREGYPLANPLLPMLQASGAGRVLRCGMLGGLYCLFAPAAWMFYGLKKRYIGLVISALALLIMWFIPAVRQATPPAWVAQVHAIPIQWSQGSDPSAPLAMIEEIIHNNPTKKIFITPESALYDPESVEAFKKQSYFSVPEVTVILGSFSATGDRFYNTLFCIQGGTVRYCHHKQHAVVLVEALPSWMSFEWLTKLHGSSPSIKRGPISDDYWHLSEDLILEPYTCSELFSRQAPRAAAGNYGTLLVCCNDSWFTGWMRYAARLMVADACLKALLWNRDCLYIGYQYAGYISKNGEFSSLNLC
jgi:hypothetical protein